MVSSVPRFPAPALNRFEFLNPQTKYGQTVICVTINQAMIALIRKFISCFISKTYFSQLTMVLFSNHNMQYPPCLSSFYFVLSFYVFLINVCIFIFLKLLSWLSLFFLFFISIFVGLFFIIFCLILF